MSRHTARIRRASQRGFTLAELMIAMLAGLVVALAVVSLSNEATNTFHEEARTAAAQMSLRTAVDRVRNDLMRAGFMSTANIWGDPVIAHAPGTPNLPDRTSFPGLARFQSLRLGSAGSINAATHSGAVYPSPPLIDAAFATLSKANGLAPDTVDISGNFTSAEAFVVRTAVPGGCGTLLTLETDSPGVLRVLATADANATINALFQPVRGAMFAVRIEDDTGHFQFIPTCANSGVVASVTGAGLTAIVVVNIANTGGYRLLAAKDTLMNGGATGLGVGRLTVNPVQTVRWELRPLASTDTVYSTQFAANVQANGGSPYNPPHLFRSFVDVFGNLRPASTELIAEFAVDFKLALSADLSAATATTRPLTVYGLSDLNNAQQNVAADSSDVALVPAAGPQRIRPVRLRVSTRSAIADRSGALMAPIANAQQGAYPLRYCTLTAGCVDSGWARVRTQTTEVALPNTAKAFY